MNKELQDLKQLYIELQSAASLIEQRQTSLPQVPQTSVNSIKESESLLHRCDNVFKRYKQSKPVIRVIHHLACSGGTLISKCLSALPNTYLLSEVHPNTTIHIPEGKPKFSPSDVTMLARYAKIPHMEKLAWDIFVSNVRVVSKHTEISGGYLVLRDHSHSDFCVGESYSQKSAVLEQLQSDFNVLSIATIRHPIDCYLSMKLRNWLGFSPSTFEEYCKRYLAFVNQFSPDQILKYEDFVDDSEQQLELISQKLELPYIDSFVDTFSSFSVTGDSGRGGDEIEYKPRRSLSNELKLEIEASESYKLLTEKLNYESAVQ